MPSLVPQLPQFTSMRVPNTQRFRTPVSLLAPAPPPHLGLCPDSAKHFLFCNAAWSSPELPRTNATRAHLEFRCDVINKNKTFCDIVRSRLPAPGRAEGKRRTFGRLWRCYSLKPRMETTRCVSSPPPLLRCTMVYVFGTVSALASSVETIVVILP